MTLDSKERMRIMRERMIAEQEKKTFSDKPKSSGGDNARYPFWTMKDGTTATVRFLPDHEDSGNPWFWVPREVIKLPFEGIVGGEYPTSKKVTVEVPCNDMFSKGTCPIIQETKPWWNDESKKELARVYYKKRSWIFQGFVVNSPFEEEELPENPIRRFLINPSIFKIIEKSLLDPEMEDLPVDYQGGTDFRISKVKKGQYANYDLSSWSRRSRPLSENELIAINQFGLFNLKDFLGRVPDADELAAIKALFHDSLAGKPFDAVSFGKYYRAYTQNDNASSDEEGGETTMVSRSVTSSSPTEEAAAEPAVAPKTNVNAQDILSRIRQRTSGANNS